MLQEPDKGRHDNDQPGLHAREEETVPQLPGVNTTPTEPITRAKTDVLCHAGGDSYITQGQIVSWHSGNLNIDMVYEIVIVEACLAKIAGWM